MDPERVLLVWGIISVALIGRIIYLLKFCVPDIRFQADKAESIIRTRLVLLKNIDEMDQVKDEFEEYFTGIENNINEAVIYYVFLNLCVFFLIQNFLNYIPLPPPAPGLLVFPKFVASLFLTTVVSSFGWLKLIVTKSETSLLRQELKDKYIILGIFEADG